MTTKPLHDTIALVTGASSGIGRETALALAEAGATVAVLARRRDRLDSLVSTVRERGGQAHSLEVDLGDVDATAAAVNSVGSRHGRIDVLVNNAGFLSNAPALEADLDDWHRTIDVNVGGVLTTTHSALPHLVSAAQGHRGVADIVTLSSIAGRKVPSSASNVYAASKHAVGAFSEALRQELAAKQVRVGVVEPGVVRTEMTTGNSKGAPDGTTGKPLLPRDLAAAIVYMVTQPAHAAVNEILLRPTEQVR